ncbi:MAG: CRISPR-associated protein Cas4 [Candidatus Acididesulfobacter diazotrophicus]|jgi:CRISPR-associated exonuclease Cas4|uniref:CRISPR-associated exonuclease Cas4 n=1 Tax=Candidatus Acididesulfobacter diazotrophicus TaxID=2597226 RepID=A0A519BMU1_9DELT|nr:MAG: CRISPR-associated protein Cas4 [Candidatus Acididesulfobacter diazotrophicus]
MDTETNIMITPSEVIEYLFCPRFTYFLNCLNIPQHEELRFKVVKGREVHERKLNINRDYLRKKIKSNGKEISVYLASPNIRVRGIVDEVLFLTDGSVAPLDYKYAEYKDYLFETHKVQLILYAMLIREIYNKPVKKGYICYLTYSPYLKAGDSGINGSCGRSPSNTAYSKRRCPFSVV